MREDSREDEAAIVTGQTIRATEKRIADAASQSRFEWAEGREGITLYFSDFAARQEFYQALATLRELRKIPPMPSRGTSASSRGMMLDQARIGPDEPAKG